MTGPRSSLTGGPKPSDGLVELEGGAVNGLRWDWYQATLTTDSALVRQALAGLGDGSWNVVHGRYGYAWGARLGGVNGGSVTVFERPEDVHVQATSAVADVVAPVLRRLWPDHGVSRADVAWDVDEPAAFDRLWRIVHECTREPRRGRRVTTSTSGDWIDGEAGRTLYAGGSTSRLRVVVYEKGLEQLAKDPTCGASRDWTRCEWRIRPDRPAGKAWLAKASPAAAVGFSPFGAQVAERVCGESVSVPAAALRFASDDPLYWMVRQYRTSVLELLTMDPLDAMLRLADLVDDLDRSRT